MVNHNKKTEGIERVTLKLSKDVAQFFRSAFPHGKRSDFVAECILKYKHQQEIKKIEEELRTVGKNRQ